MLASKRRGSASSSSTDVFLASVSLRNIYYIKIYGVSTVSNFKVLLPFSGTSNLTFERRRRAAAARHSPGAPFRAAKRVDSDRAPDETAYLVDPPWGRDPIGRGGGPGRQMAADVGPATLNPAGLGRKCPAASGTADFGKRERVELTC